ncbi:hypothetical protein BHE90_003215 [Fusarium euwallaceae]|uniref:Copper acquisition factor BIM1-like domain-containing protein n=5 Tax=Fusarium solani species complex TaxID=232080 RepID=A0A3M2RP21_9HYPO|nr:hypothetical protein CDV36_013337 [Fusarium kuroshium]RSL81516.1 hypothetical protein CEP51_005788 [Fusarium floridanum]RSL99909.1 hypothetical protein CEP52_009453 [Fusarium oligoseptatum]RSM18254.1 hypothetical protein CDV31_002980 [Fusarium ambrosium]RTE82228.1 hypothetical protein BHE90_003215 [Fusarium euwallaceae]
MTMLKNLLLLGLATFVVGRPDDDDIPTGASVTDDEMGPAAFMWPADRVWSGDVDNKAPCGSKASAGNRTDFPLTGGAVALVAQDDYYNAKISISYSSDPSSNDDFETLVEEKSIADLNPGHTCVLLPDAPSKISAGDNATIQIIYRADWDAPHNQTFYACADITYVSEANFDFEIPCFNATEPGDDDKAAGVTASGSATATHQSTKETSTSESSEDNEEKKSGGSKGLSGGAIAGIVVGSVVGALAILGAGLFLWRRKQQQERNQRIARMEDNARKHQLATDSIRSSQA